MTLRSRLALGLVTIAIILVGPLVLAIYSLRALSRDAKILANTDLAASMLLGQLREGLSSVRHTELGLLFTHDGASRDAMDRQVIRESRRFPVALRAWTLRRDDQERCQSNR
jgi:hypothetical protein